MPKLTDLLQVSYVFDIHCVRPQTSCKAIKAFVNLISKNQHLPGPAGYKNLVDEQGFIFSMFQKVSEGRQALYYRFNSPRYTMNLSP